jgi:serine/threonine protein kinase
MTRMGSRSTGIGQQITSALDFAHQHGRVHRHIKP